MKNMTTLKDIAETMGVSITTVSKAMRNHPDISAKKKKEILEAARRMNYVPNATARNLKYRKTNLICVIISDNTNPYYASFLKSVEEKTSQHGYFTIIFNSNEVPKREGAFLAMIRSLNVAGVIITPALDGRQNVSKLRATGIPFVLANRYVSRDRDTYVTADDEAAGYMATRHILERHKGNRVMFFGPTLEVSSARDRFSGYERALQEKGRAAGAETSVLGLFTQEQAYQNAREVIAKNTPPYSIVCYSDYIASGVCKALNEAAIAIPDEVSLIGIDNIELFSFTHPSLTTVEIPKEEIAHKSVECLLRLIKEKESGKEGKEQRIVVKPRLVARESA